MKRVHGMQKNITVNTTMGRMPMLMIPYQRKVFSKMISSFIIYLYGDDIIFSKFKMWCKVETKRNKSRLIFPQVNPVDIYIGNLTNGFKLYKHFFIPICLWDLKMFSIPNSSSPLIVFTIMMTMTQIVEGISVIIGMRTAYGFPRRIIIIFFVCVLRIGFNKFPINIKVVLRSITF
ncbi:hypothetical protein JCM19302_2332 [Jejuia pallidilutea]|uniref:Uncharacterized protein n=1 Tax=Jejuia pallidilutea TaxID=504487 RepID=A0A090WZ71_9FLAO|nr:hypothetical protein JCM19302_2332 [Jejuia pallidilutea]GAL88691.1 hypothetical protein JCM19538_3204 [Jejuia pallidilutea]